METDEKEDKELLKMVSPVRKHAFARMVSWEFSQPKQPCRNRRKKQRVGSVTAEEDEEEPVAADNGDGADSDEYYTAEEEISSGSEEESASLLEGLSISDDAQLPRAERQGGRSKSQKRRRKRIYRQKQLDFFAPFADADAAAGDPVEAVTSGDLNPVKSVPTLMEICLRACSQGGNHGGGPLPMLKQHRDELRQRRAFHSLQLKWLHRVLSENERGVHPRCLSDGQQSRRCVFQEDLDESPLWYQQVNVMRSLMVKCNLPEAVHQSPKITVLAHAIDLMLPGTFKCKSSADATTDEDEIMAKARQSAVVKVKIALRARYPRFVEHLFDVALAYVWWARGHLSQASELLYQVADKIKPTTSAGQAEQPRGNTPHLLQAMYMNEAGLMYAMFGDPAAAAKCYRQAAEVSCNGAQSPAQDLVVLQSLILSAAAWDQGLLNKMAAARSSSAWNAVMASPGDCPLEVVYAAVEAFLCFHAGHSTDFSARLSREDETEAWLLEAREKIEKLMKLFPNASQLKLYHSFVCAMLGNGVDSVQSLRYFTASCAPSTYPNGFPAPQIREATKNSAFQPLINVATATKKPISALALLWRRQLVHPTISNASNDVIADRWNMPLNLHITDEGYLTGDMCLNLPPMRAVLLDPYNGSVCIPHTPSVSHPWKSVPDFRDGSYHADHLPMPIRVYEDASRHVTVELVSVSHPEKDHWSSQALYLQWKDPRRTYKLNVRNIVKKVMKEEIVKRAQEEYKAKDTSFSQNLSHFEERLKKLEEHYQRGWVFHYSHIFGSSPPCKCGEKKPKQKRYMYSVSMFNICVQNVVRYGRASVLLLLNTERARTANKGTDTLVFLDISSLEAFLQPVVHYVGAHSNRLFDTKTVPETSNLGASHHEVSVIGFTRPDSKCNHLCLHTYDEHGKLLDVMSIKDLQKSRSKSQTVTHGHAAQLYGLRPENDEQDEDDEMAKVVAYDMKTKRHWKSVDLFQARQLVAGFNTVFVRTETALVVLDASTLLSVDVTFDSGGHSPGEAAAGLWLNRPLANIGVLASRKITRTGASGEAVDMYRMVFTADNKVYLLDRLCANSDEALSPLNVVTEVEIAGRATEAHYISEQVGFVVSVTLNDDLDRRYRECLYWYSSRGELKGVLPFLANKGSHSFYSVYLSGDDSQAETEGWYLYFTDGHGAICAAKLL